MTNAEKYLKEGVDIKEFSRNMFNYLVNRDEPLKIKIENYLQEDIKPTLTEDERVILRNIPKNHTRIRRSTYKDKICGKELAPLEIVNDGGKYYTLYILSHLFQFIKERRRI